MAFQVLSSTIRVNEYQIPSTAAVSYQYAGADGGSRKDGRRVRSQVLYGLLQEPGMTAVLHGDDSSAA